MSTNNNYYQPFEKPLQHLGIDDWYSRTDQLCNLANVRRTNAYDVRQSSRNLRNESQVQSYFNTVNNNARLANRYLSIKNIFLAYY